MGGQAMKPIETASALYREIKQRGLHLREKDGRDNALLRELTAKLGCPDARLQRFLDASDLSAEAFLRVFLQLAAPFASMFQEIWAYLNRQRAPKATETISVRFGFEDSDDRRSLNLEQFRRCVETAEQVLALATTQLWPLDALRGLFDVGRRLVEEGCEPTRKLYDERGRYEPGKPYDLPIVKSSGHPFDEVVKNVRHVFQQIIDGCMSERERRDGARRLPEVKEDAEQLNEDTSLQRSVVLLTDLLPGWFFILVECSGLGGRAKDAALQEYKKSVQPFLTSGKDVAEVPLLAALDILDLPFWRHRWHTYEVWATVLTLGSLQDYRPALKIEKGYVALDGYAAAVVADLKAREHPSACVAVQVQTPFQQGKRKAIKPDLRVCFDDPSSADNTAGVVEFKQRRRIESKALTEMAVAYSNGCPHSGGVVILNYDRTDTPVPLPPGSYLIEGVHPLNPDAIELFQRRLSQILRTAGLSPMNEETAVLLDVSWSMGDSYQDRDVQSFLRALLDLPWVKILRFNNGLLEGGDLDATTAESLATSGGTQLGRALSDVESLFGLPSKLLIVTDGKHDNPRDILSRIPKMRECLPKEIGKNIAWLS